MSPFSTSPKLSKGRIDVVDPSTQRVSYSIPFQFNPDTLTRSLNPQWMQGGYNRTNKCNALRMNGVPEETIRLEVEIDAAEDLSKYPLGIYPQIAALENLIYPSTTSMMQMEADLGRGVIEIVPPEAPRTLLVWGKSRVLPVQLTDLSITEETHDADLNPLQAKVSLSLRVLSYNDLPLNHPACSDFRIYHKMLEEMAKIARR